MEIISKADAIARGLKHYFTGKPCSRGHLTIRLVSQHKCMECKRADERRRNNAERNTKKGRVWRLNNPEKERNRGRERRKNITPEMRKIALKATLKWISKNPDKVRASRAAWRANNLDRARANCESWRKKNLTKARALSANRRARMRNAPGKYSSEDIDRLFTEQEGKCVYCKIDLSKYHVDHIVPIVRGGSNWPSNLQLTCPPCNQKKHAKDPAEFAKTICAVL